MASTFVAILVDYRQRQALIGNLGDSRCYVFRSAQAIAQSAIIASCSALSMPVYTLPIASVSTPSATCCMRHLS